LCTPPDKEGNVNPAILFAANLCGVTKILKVGGIQAIGMTFGTESIPKVYKIFWSWEPIRNSGEAISNPIGV
jgi:histidinol dehydrogenase